MTIDVRRVASMAKIRIEESELESYEAKMRAMLEMMEDMPETDGMYEELVEENAMVLRKDIVEPSLDRDALLSNAPEKNAGCFGVPKTV